MPPFGEVNSPLQPLFGEINSPLQHQTVPLQGRGSGVIWNISPNETPVIPAKAGIQSVKSASPRVCGVDSRFRGNDCGLERPCLPNDAITRAVLSLTLL